MRVSVVRHSLAQARAVQRAVEAYTLRHADDSSTVKFVTIQFDSVVGMATDGLILCDGAVGEGVSSFPPIKRQSGDRNRRSERRSVPHQFFDSTPSLPASANVWMKDLWNRGFVMRAGAFIECLNSDDVPELSQWPSFCADAWSDVSTENFVAASAQLEEMFGNKESSAEDVDSFTAVDTVGLKVVEERADTGTLGGLPSSVDSPATKPAAGDVWLMHSTSGELKRLCVPVALSSDVKVRMIACGKTHCVVVSEAHVAYSLGRAVGGALGLGPGVSSARSLSAMKFANGRGPSIVDSVACGSRHSLVLTAKGDIFGCGNPTRGALGQLSPRETSCGLLCIIPLPFLSGRVRLVSAGNEYNVLVTDTDQMVEFGTLCMNLRTVETPRVFGKAWSTGYRIITVSIGLNHAVVVLRHDFSHDESLAMWGSNHAMQLVECNATDGIRVASCTSLPSDAASVVPLTTLNSAFDRVSSLSCGGYGTAVSFCVGGCVFFGSLGDGTPARSGGEHGAVFRIPLVEESTVQSITVSQACSAGEAKILCATGRGLEIFNASALLRREMPLLLAVMPDRIVAAKNFTLALISSLDAALMQHVRDSNVAKAAQVLSEMRVFYDGPDACLEEVLSTALLAAARANFPEMCQVLVLAGAVPTFEVLCAALESFHDETDNALDVLIGRGSLAATWSETLLDIQTQKTTGDTLLHVAVNRADEAVVRHLVSKWRPNLRATNRALDSVLHVAVRGAFPELQTSPDGKTNTDINGAPTSESKPFPLAHRRASWRIALFLTARAAPVSMENAKRQTALDLAPLEASVQLSQLAEQTEVFISYAHADIALARFIKAAIERWAGLKVWMDDWRLSAGEDWRADIGKGVQQCLSLVFISSPTSVQSQWCLKEVKLARSCGKAIYVLKAVDCEPSTWLSEFTATLRKKRVFDISHGCVDSSVAELSLWDQGKIAELHNLCRALRAVMVSFERGSHDAHAVHMEPLDELQPSDFSAILPEPKKNARAVRGITSKCQGVLPIQDFVMICALDQCDASLMSLLRGRLCELSGMRTWAECLEGDIEALCVRMAMAKALVLLVSDSASDETIGMPLLAEFLEDRAKQSEYADRPVFVCCTGASPSAPRVTNILRSWQRSFTAAGPSRALPVLHTPASTNSILENSVRILAHFLQLSDSARSMSSSTAALEQQTAQLKEQRRAFNAQRIINE